LSATQQDVVDAARAANAHEFILGLPEGYGTTLGERGAKVSGGERQRIAMARAFLKDAPILILDEPTSSVDLRTEAVILDGLERLMEGRTTVIVAHRLSTLRRADRILVLDGGRLVEQGTSEELIEAAGLFSNLHSLHTGAGVQPQISRPQATHPPLPRWSGERRSTLV
jgi:ABC-type multidrug transport system fused ATPase/permease subunit